MYIFSSPNCRTRFNEDSCLSCLWNLRLPYLCIVVPIIDVLISGIIVRVTYIIVVLILVGLLSSLPVGSGEGGGSNGGGGSLSTFPVGASSIISVESLNTLNTCGLCDHCPQYQWVRFPPCL
jgi:hypothetical protein